MLPFGNSQKTLASVRDFLNVQERRHWMCWQWPGATIYKRRRGLLNRVTYHSNQSFITFDPNQTIATVVSILKKTVWVIRRFLVKDCNTLKISGDVPRRTTFNFLDLLNPLKKIKSLLNRLNIINSAIILSASNLQSHICIYNVNLHFGGYFCIKF